MRIIVDAMGGDHAPQAAVAGALEAHKRDGTEILLVGQETAILQALQDCGQTQLPAGVRIIPASEVIDMEDDPATAFKRKKDSSITVGLNLLKQGEGDAFVSAGSTGALLAAATLLVKRVHGIRRAALAPVLPHGGGGYFVLMDCGANAECTVEYLLQFAYLGSFYAHRMLGIANPRVGLLNIGTEPSKGDTLRQETYRALREAHERGELNFVGNVEAKEAMLGACDVLVADGFSGNVMLKTMEGVAVFLGGKIKQMFLKNGLTKLSALLMKDGMRDFKKTLNPDDAGGTVFLGISRPVIKAHGSSNGKAMAQAIAQARRTAESGILSDIEDYMAKQRDSEKEKE